MNRSLERILPRVQKPARYTGGEYNAVVKDRRKVEVRYALCFPDTYEIGMSNLGVRILYGVMNNLPWCWCERVFAPWGDMEEEMRAEGLPLYGLESGDSIADFDLIGFSLGYEMAYTNVLNMLDLAGLPVRAEERHELSPIVVAGGTCAFNPEPLAPFVDIFSLGEGEDVSVELLELYRKAKGEGWEKEEFLQAAAQIPGLYVPSLYDISYHEDGTVAAITPRDGAPAVVTKRIVQDFNKSYFPVKTIVPSTECTQEKVTLELPSLRADNFSMNLMHRLQHGKKSGLTFAPEAGTQRLRDAINKNVTEEELLQSCRTAFSGGWSSVKLYFMLGLPTETDEDVLGIADLAEKVYRAWRETTPEPRRGVRITVSTSFFVPKPHTAFQWEGQISMEEYQRRVKLLRDNMRGRSISYNWHDPDTSVLEAVFARGDRRVADVIEEAWRNGAKFDSWSEYFDFQRWQDAFAACGLSMDFYATRQRDKGEILPWDMISTGVRKPFLWREREQCYQNKITPDCRKQCTGCGADKLYPGGKCDAE